MLADALMAVPGVGAVSAPFSASGQSTWLGSLPLAIPEASSLALLIVGLTAVGVVTRRRHARLAAQAGDAGDTNKGVGHEDSCGPAGFRNE